MRPRSPNGTRSPFCPCGQLREPSGTYCARHRRERVRLYYLKKHGPPPTLSHNPDAVRARRSRQRLLSYYARERLSRSSGIPKTEWPSSAVILKATALLLKRKIWQRT